MSMQGGVCPDSRRIIWILVGGECFYASLLHEEASFPVVGHDDETVRINNLGTFKIVRNKEREGHNPRTGEKIVLLVLTPIPKV